MRSAELTSTKAPREPAADLQAACSRSLHIVAGVHQADFEALALPRAAGREASAQPPAHRLRGPAAAAARATALWLRRALADSARAWALAAGVPPDLYR